MHSHPLPPWNVALPDGQVSVFVRCRNKAVMASHLLQHLRQATEVAIRKMLGLPQVQDHSCGTWFGGKVVQIPAWKNVIKQRGGIPNIRLRQLRKKRTKETYFVCVKIIGVKCKICNSMIPVRIHPERLNSCSTSKRTHPIYRAVYRTFIQMLQLFPSQLPILELRVLPQSSTH